jgi:hypothetical protein
MTYIPEAPNKYSKPQIIINSSRLIFNAYDDSVFISSKQAIGLSSNGTINFDSKGNFIVNSPKIQLGLNASEPILLGDSTGKWLSKLLDNLNKVSQNLAILTSLPPGTPFAPLNQSAIELNLVISELNNDINSLKSKNNFTI